MRPGDLPDRTCVTARRVGTSIHTQTWGYRSPFESVSTRPLRLAVYDVKDLYCPIRGARRKPLAIVVELGIVLGAAYTVSPRLYCRSRPAARDVRLCPHGKSRLAWAPQSSSKATSLVSIHLKAQYRENRRTIARR